MRLAARSRRHRGTQARAGAESSSRRFRPHVVALQRAGMTFSHYYVVDSLCCPARSAIFTGE
jgi:arylsulfatase A-like enzyme